MGVLISAATITQFLLAIFLAIVGPVWDYFDTLKLRAHPSGKARLGYYRRTMLWLWTAACIALVTPGWHALFTLRGAGIQIASQKWAWWTTASLLALVILVQLVLPVVQVTLKYRNRAFLEPRQFESMRFFLPAARLERRWFAALCVTAGFCEELLFRGFLLRFMHGAPLRLGILWAIPIAALIFGLHHLYLGRAGFLSTTLGGLVFIALFLLTGSLLAVMIFHALSDLAFLLYWRPKSIAEAA